MRPHAATCGYMPPRRGWARSRRFVSCLTGATRLAVSHPAYRTASMGFFAWSEKAMDIGYRESRLGDSRISPRLLAGEVPGGETVMSFLIRGDRVDKNGLTRVGKLRRDDRIVSR